MRLGVSHIQEPRFPDCFTNKVNPVSSCHIEAKITTYQFLRFALSNVDKLL